MRSNVFFGLIAVAVMATVSCNKEIENVVPVVPTNGTHTVCFKADEVATKTSLVLNGTTYSAIWTDDDEANFHIFENGVEGVAEMTKSSDSKSATFKATFNDGATAPFNYTAILSSEYNDVNNSASVAYIQNPAANNIDGAADLLIAKPVVLNAQPAVTDEIHFQFKRVVSINKMTIRGLEVGEKVTEVTISGDKKIAAVYDVAADEFDYTLGEDAIILGYTDNNDITSAGTFDVYFVCAPVENATLSIEVKTEDNSNPVKTRTYKKDFTKTISFDLTTVAEFVANVTCCEEVTGSSEEISIFKETFDKTTGTGGNDGAWKGNIATNNISADNDGWTFSNNGGGDQCIKMGTGNASGSATTPALGITASSATITFKAAAWSSEDATISLSASGSATVSLASNSLPNSEWGAYSAVITGGDESTTITFTASENRFFLDEVEVKEVRNSDPNTVSLTIADNTEISGSETEATINIVSNKAWTVTSNDPLLANTPISIKGTAQDGSFTVSFKSANSSFTQDKVATLHIVAGAGSYAQEKDITVTHLKAVPVLTVDSATKTVEASATSTSFTVTECNFDWDVISVKVDGSENTDYTAVKGENGVVNVSFPSNSAIDATTDEKSIVVTVGADDILTTSCTITQEGEAYLDPSKKYFIPVNATLDDWSGIYLIVSGTKAYNGAAASGSNNEGVDVTITENVIEADETTKLNSVVVSNGSTSQKWYIKGKTGYIGGSSNSGGFTVSDEGIDNTIEYSDDGTIIKSSSFTLRYNAGHFRYYSTSTTGSAVKLYKFNGNASDLAIGKLEVGTVSCTNDGQSASSLSFSWDAVTGAVKYFVSADGGEYTDNGTATTYTMSGLNPNTTHSISVKAIGDGVFYTDSDPKNASGTTKDNQGGSGGTPKTSTLTFTAACGGSGTADDNVSWTVTSDGSESNFDSTKGIHYGTSKNAVSYLTLSSSGIVGTITSIKVNASGASGTSATVNITVGNSDFGSEQSLTSSAADYTFTGSASGTIVVSIKQSSAKKALYCKSITVTYTN